MTREDLTLTTGEAAALCGVSRSTLRRAVAQGHLKAWHTPGKHLRFSEAACLSFAQSLGRLDVELVGRRYLMTERMSAAEAPAVDQGDDRAMAHPLRP
ncbi:MAG: excisionase family DNA-binding protein [Candidatus Dormibacteria bacterium]